MIMEMMKNMKERGNTLINEPISSMVIYTIVGRSTGKHGTPLKFVLGSQ
jgi:hypothetical protein